MIDRPRVIRRRNRSLVSAVVAVLATLMFAASTIAAGWGSPIQLGTSGNYGIETARSMAVSGSTLHAIMWQDQSIAYQRSTDGGVSWLPDVQLATASSTATFHALAIATSGNLVVALFKAKGPGTHQSLYLRRSTDGGQTWKAKQIVASYASTSKEMGDGDVVVVGSKVLVAWTDRTTSKILARRSTNRGATFQPVQTIGTTSNGSGAFRDGDLAAAAAGTMVYIVWVPRNAKGITLRRSTDNGATWKPKQSITGAAVDYHGPAASASGSSLLVMYTLATHAVKVARSTNKGSSQTSSTVVSGDLYPTPDDIFISGTTARLTYVDGGHVKLRSSSNGGGHWGAAADVSDYGAHSNVVVTGGHTIIVWEAPDEFSATSFAVRSN